ncbi:MAG: NUDIX domain-containing protein [Candidatus Pacearchaeota archaeon]|jgi:8-oxo-dGTP pyrophosphatase MutT (NUDIX family)
MVKYRKGVFIVTYRKEKGKIWYLLLKRKLHWKGWEFPKGGAENNESLRQTAIRELKEETGQKVTKVKSYPIKGKYLYDKEYEDRKGFIGQSYQLFSAEVKSGCVIFDKHEHSGYKWLEFDKAFSMLTFPDKKVCLNYINKRLIKK